MTGRLTPATPPAGSGRGFRFGVVFTGDHVGPAWTELARRVEGEGFSTLLVADHYTNPMACGPLLTAAAAATTTLRVGSYVYNNDFRPPALLAKEAATIDVLSDGRLELGIGAGWAKIEYQLAGVHFDPGVVRADRFEEAVGIIRRLLDGEAVEHRGEHYTLRGLPGMPRPVQDPVPLVIGGGGPRMMRIAADVAATVSFVPPALPDGGLDPRGMTGDAMDERIARLDAAIARAGRVDGGPERNVLIFAIGDSIDSVQELRALSPSEVAESPHVLPADPSAIIDALHERRERWGLTYSVCFAHELDMFAGVVSALT